MLASLPVAILNHDSRQMGIPHDSKQDDNALGEFLGGAMAMPNNSLTVKPLAGALGAEIHGIDLAEPLGDATFA